MKTIVLSAFLLLSGSFFAQDSFSRLTDTIVPTPYVNFDDYLALAMKVKEHRKTRLVTWEKFQELSKEKNTIILDTRSDEMYNQKHIKGAIHLNFSDFTSKNLEELIPNKNTRILIYCNNNIEDDEIYFPTKSYSPPKTTEEDITLALNIPTYINLYGYGYENVYELGDLVPAFVAEFEGTAVK